MEKITINEIKPIMMGDAMAVTLADGRKCTAWADKIDPSSLRIGECIAEIVPYTSKTGKQGLNITKVDMTSGVKGQVYATTDGSNQDHLAGIAVEDKDYSTNQRIAAAVELKCAVELVSAVIAAGAEIEEGRLGELICATLKEVYAAHKLALSMQDER